MFKKIISRTKTKLLKNKKEIYIPVTTAHLDWDDYHRGKLKPTIEDIKND